MRVFRIPLSAASPLATALVAAVVAALAGACSQQGEGMVCDPRAGNDGNADCQDGLVCTEPTDLAPGTMGSRCCPGDPALATGVCALGTSTVPEDSAVPEVEAGAEADDSGDGATEAGDAAGLDP